MTLLKNPAFGCPDFVLNGARKLRRVLRHFLAEFLRRVGAKHLRFGPPAGTFSAAEQLRSRSFKFLAAGEILVEGQDSPRAPADSIIALSGLKQDQYQPCPVFWCRIDEVHVIGRAQVLLDAEKRACFECFMHEHALASEEDYHYFALPAAQRLEGNWTSLNNAHFSSNNFYHWLHDSVAKLALLEHFPPDTLILLENPEIPFKRDVLELLGLWDRVRPSTHRHYLVEHYYFAPALAITGCYNRLGTEFLRKSILPKISIPERTPRRIFVTRRGTNRGLENAAAVEEFFAQAGWEVLDPGTLPFIEQVRVFAGAEEICAVHGGALANIVWCRSECRLLELFPESRLNGCYEVLANTVGMRYAYQIFPAGSQFRLQVDIKSLQEKYLAAFGSSIS